MYDSLVSTPSSISLKPLIGILGTSAGNPRNVPPLKAIFDRPDVLVVEINPNTFDPARSASFFHCDAFVVPGRPTNVHPSFYGSTPLADIEQSFDVKSDRLSFAMIAESLTRRVPFLGICSGMQLMQVYFGGILHQCLEHVVGDIHSSRYRPGTHQLEIIPGGLFEKMFASQQPFWTNSSHEQGILSADLLPEDLAAEAVCKKTGVIEAASHRTHPYMLGVQYHPESNTRGTANPHYAAVFSSFIEQAHTYAASRHRAACGLGAKPIRIPLAQPV
ncbi:MAG: gamma-glutamyl-gamma-aminobutyrate hydrolase family protein [Bdellovibrionales bacterium]